MNNDTKLASILDLRIRAVVEEALRGPITNDLRDLVRTEMMDALGILAPKNTAVAPMAPVAPMARLGRRPKAMMAKNDGSICNVVGCGKPHRARGYCASHYQAARKFSWPRPAPASFEPPARQRA